MTSAEPENAPSLKDFRALLETSPKRAAEFLANVHAADAAEWLQDVSEEDAWLVFAALDAEDQADVLECAEESLRTELVQQMSSTDLAEVVEELPSDEAVDVLADADERVVEDVLGTLESERAQELRELGAYPPDSAGGVMTTEFVTVRLGDRVGDAVKEVKKEGEDAEEIGVFVVDADEKPVGYLSERDLLTHSIHTSVAEVMVDPFTIGAAEDQEEAATRIAKYTLSALGVVGEDGALLGVISAEDAQDILEEEVSEDILRMVGTAPTLQTRLPILVRVRQRMPLMAVTVGGGLLSAKILALFLGGEGAAVGGATASVLRYLPLIVGLAGNVGIQSSTILVRAFATGEVERDREASVLASEVAAGTLIGFLCGALTVVLAPLLEGAGAPDGFGLAVGAAVFVAVAWAALLGCVIPMGCRRLGIDPAVVAGPFLICLSDVSGSAIFILVARQLLGLGETGP